MNSKDNVEDTLGFVGRNVRQLRKWRGYTIEALAESIGVQRVPLGQMERGSHAPSARTLLRLGQIFEVPESAFFSRDDETLRLFYEASLKEPFQVDSQMTPLPRSLAEKADRLVCAWLELEDLCGVAKRPRLPLNIGSTHTEEGMCELAWRVRRRMDVGNAVIWDYIELLESQGFRVIFFPMGKVESFAHYDPENSNAFFFVNRAMNPEKQLFNLLMELGTVMLYVGRLSSMQTAVRRTEGTLDMDQATARRLAKAFASHFLMPADAVKNTVEQLGIQPNAWTPELLYRMKHRFGVSAEAFLYRLQELELLSTTRRQEIKGKIYDHYRDTNFNEPDATRRRLNYNGRIWDLLLSARLRLGAAAAVARIEDVLTATAVRQE